MAKLQIKSIWETLLFEHEGESIKDAVVQAVKGEANLTGANLIGANLDAATLTGADLTWANLTGANLSGANLTGANLTRANLSGTNLTGANLSGATLGGANLTGATLTGTTLTRANLSGTNLSGANLTWANLTWANLSGADLTWANLTGANLTGANLTRANLTWANLSGVKGLYPIVPDVGSFVGFKKLTGGVIAKILIPEDAQRVGGIVGRKCRASKAVVLEGSGTSNYDSNFTYAVGEVLTPDSFDANPYVECSNGIHFFITREEAESYS